LGAGFRYPADRTIGKEKKHGTAEFLEGGCGIDSGSHGVWQAWSAGPAGKQPH
jgi:hypothetical protein